MTASIPLLFVNGSHYEVWKQVGWMIGDRVRRFMEDSESLKRHLAYSETPEGGALVKEYLDSSKEDFPQYVDELRGLADGVGVSFEHLFILNLEFELMCVLEQQPKETKAGKSCSDVYVNNGEHLLIGHNEDYHPGVEKVDFMLCAKFNEFIDDRGRVFPPESLLTHAIPGILPGCSFCLNGHGFGYSINTILVPPAKQKSRVISECMLMRALAASKDVADAERTMKAHSGGTCVGFNVNAGQSGVTDILWSLEVGPDHVTGETSTHVLEVRQQSAPYGHFNGYQHSKLEFVKGKGSEIRKARFTQVPSPQTPEDVLAFLGDSHDPEYPVFRTGKSPDGGCTTCTALFDFKKRNLKVYRGNPAKTIPLVSLPFDVICA